MGAFLYRINSLVNDWGLTDILAVGLGAITSVVILFMPLKDVEHTDDFAAITFAIAIVAIAVTCVIAVPQVWRDGYGSIYSLFFCLLVGGAAFVRFRLGGSDIKVIVKSAKDDKDEKSSG